LSGNIDNNYTTMKKLYVFFALQFFFAPLIFNMGGTQCSAQCPDGLIIIVRTATVTDATVGESNGSLCACKVAGGATPYTYAWGPTGGTDLCANNLSAGTYNMKVTDNNGCTVESSYNVASVPQSVRGGQPPYTYIWSNGQSGASATGMSVGTYTLVVNDNNKIPKEFVKTTIIEKYLSYILLLFTVLLVMLFTRLDRKYHTAPTKPLNTARWTIALILALVFLCLIISMFLLNPRGAGIEI
jgi:hypothetical protein